MGALKSKTGFQVLAKNAHENQGKGRWQREEGMAEDGGMKMMEEEREGNVGGICRRKVGREKTEESGMIDAGEGT